jgi:1-pyrroline-5-carboxylate dehydrogenase
MRPPFQSEPTTDFKDPRAVETFRAALARVQQNLGASYPLVIGAERLSAGEEFSVKSPADPERVIGRFPKADRDTALRALETADRAFPAWARTPAEERANYLFGAAGQVRKKRHDLAAWMVYEVGKSWAEADGEVAECVDLMEYYARQMLDLAGSQTARLASLPDENTDFFYVPLGAGVVISPWNFPMALTFGMASAAIVTGNSVVIKPASTSATSVYQFAQILLDLGLPPGVLNLVTGSGSVVGNALVEHPRTRFVAFTGSMEVGCGIHERAARVQPGQVWIKRTVLEMGGKNAVIVDREADLDAAVEGVLASAFSYQGQKCSAGSRAIIDAEIYDAFLEKLSTRARELKVGDPVDPAVDLGPVIDGHAFESILKFIETGKKEGRLLTGGDRAPGKGYFIQPTIFADLDRNATIAQEEIFGPVLACIRAKDFDDALAIANGTKYGLTGAVFSRNRAKLERARFEFHVGNLYFNRKSTGAMMGVHPFGGFNMSGTDSKAGGPDYLLLFLQGKAIGDRLV